MPFQLNDVYEAVNEKRDVIIKEWLDSDSLFPILNSINMSKLEYERDIANSVLNYFLSVLVNKEPVGDCPMMRQMIENFIDSGLCSEDVFLNCTIFKNKVVETLYDSAIEKNKITQAIKILDNNLYKILGVYTKKRVIKDQKSLLYSKLVEEHVSLSVTNTDGVMTRVTDAFCKLTAYERNELIGHTHQLLRHEDMSSDFFKVMWKSLLKNHKWKGKIKNRKKDGGEFIAKTEIIPVENEHGELIEYVAIRHDITDKIMSNIDQLTNLSNRKVYFENIQDILSQNEHASIMVLDIDYFKNVNDTYGHSFGDLVLKEFAGVLTTMVREKDLCIRWGGEEFVVLLPSTALETATKIAQRIRIKIDELMILNKEFDEKVDIKCSIGVTQYILNENIDDFFNRADKNLYEAKNSGRNQVVSV